MKEPTQMENRKGQEFINLVEVRQNMKASFVKAFGKVKESL